MLTFSPFLCVLRDKRGLLSSRKGQRIANTRGGGGWEGRVNRFDPVQSPAPRISIEILPRFFSFSESTSLFVLPASGTLECFDFAILSRASILWNYRLRERKKKKKKRKGKIGTNVVVSFVAFSRAVHFALLITVLHNSLHYAQLLAK